MAYHRPFSVRTSTLAVTVGLFYVLSLSVHPVGGQDKSSNEASLMVSSAQTNSTTGGGDASSIVTTTVTSVNSAETNGTTGSDASSIVTTTVTSVNSAETNGTTGSDASSIVTTTVTSVNIAETNGTTGSDASSIVTTTVTSLNSAETNGTTGSDASSIVTTTVTSVNSAETNGTTGSDASSIVTTTVTSVNSAETNGTTGSDASSIVTTTVTSVNIAETNGTTGSEITNSSNTTSSFDDTAMAYSTTTEENTSFEGSSDITTTSLWNTTIVDSTTAEEINSSSITPLSVSNTTTVNSTATEEDSTSASTSQSTNVITTHTTMAPTTTPAKVYNDSCTDKCSADLTCVNNKCGCTSNEYYDPSNTTDLCQTKKPYDDPCISTDQCSANLTCVGYKCGCTSNEYHDPSNTADLCRTKLNYNDPCDGISAPDACQGPNTVCTSYKPSSPKKCLCATDYYRSDNGACVPKSNLQINLDEASQVRGTTYIVFSWTGGSNRGNITYTISWNGGNLSANKDGRNVTGLIPGTPYNFTITSTLPEDSNYAPITVESKPPMLWTYPVKPGSVESVTPVPSSPSPPYLYNIIFGKSEGAVSYYKIDVAGISNTSTSNAVILTLTPGASYSYTLKSVNGKGDESESITGSFTTSASASGPVLNLNTTDILELKANIKWQTPSATNGNITGYLIQVILEEGGICLYNIKLKCSGCSQPPDVNASSCPNSGTPANSTFESGYYHLQLPNLKPYHNYTAVVSAVNEKGLGQERSTTFRTAVGAANDVSNLSLTSTRDNKTRWVSLNISWTSGEFTDPQTITFLCATKQDQTLMRTLQALCYTSMSLVLGDVMAFWNYRVSVMAGTTKGNSSSVSQQTETSPNNPGVVEKLIVTQDAVDATKVIGTFSCPEEHKRNGTITRFEIRQSLLDSENKTVNITNYNVDPATISCTSDNSFTGQNINAEKSYEFAVKAVNIPYEGDFGQSIFLHTSPRIPQLDKTMSIFGKQQLVKKSATYSPEETRIPVEVCARCLTDNRQGTVTKVGLLICVKGQSCDQTGRKRRSTDPYADYSSYPTWSKAKVNDFKDSYRTTPDDWIQTLTNGESFTIGQNASCPSYPDSVHCNGPLPAGKEFRITTIVCTSAGCSTYRENEVFVLKAPPVDNTGAIVGGVLGGLAFIAIICLIVFLIWRFWKPCKKPKRTTNTFNQLDEITKEIKLKRPVKIRNFNDHVTRFHRDSNLLFQDEFESIQTLCKAFTFPSEQGRLEQNKVNNCYGEKPVNYSCEQAKLEANRGKNRYVDIIPYDHSRVKLDILPDDDETKDFINANYIPGYNSVREYIATQGPMYSTIPDFWRMAWEQKCKVIVMLSDLMESGKRKVDLYWPENLHEPINYEHVVVEMTNFSQMNKYIIRNFKVTKGDEVRKITHFFLPGWSDFSADLGLDVVLGFVKLVRQEATPANPGPIIVHCSAGVGRTGTLIALDYFTQFVEKHGLDDEVDIFDFAMQMRRNRCRMVQVESQYIFIYDAINKVIQQKIEAEKERLLENSSSNGVYANMALQEDNIYQNSNVKERNVYNNEAFEPDYSNIGNSKKSEKPTTEL